MASTLRNDTESRTYANQMLRQVLKHKAENPETVREGDDEDMEEDYDEEEYGAGYTFGQEYDE